MQISDLVHQYNNNMATGGEISTKSQGVEQLVSTVQKLTAGQVFEGTVNSIKGNTVILGLSSGQNITATLTRDILLEQGQSVFFQVKSNDGSTIQIKPVSNNAMNNPTLLNALDSANLAVNERNVNMVNNMMREQMPIDSASLNNMARIVNSNSDINVSTIIQMNKAGIEITPQMAAQYENYQSNQSSVMNMLSELSSSIPEMLSSKELDYAQATALNKEIVNILSGDAVSTSNSGKEAEAIAMQATNAKGELIYATDENGQPAIIKDAANLVGKDGANNPNAQNINTNANAVNGNATATQTGADIKNGIDSFINQVNNSSENVGKEVAANNNAANTANATVAANADGNAVNTMNAANTSDSLQNVTLNYNRDSYPVNTIGHTLTEDQYKALNEMIKNDTNFLSNNAKLVDENGNLNPKANVTDFVKAFANYIDNVDVSKHVIKNLFSSDSYKALINNMTNQQWTLDPADVAKKDPVKQLYEKLEHSMSRLEQATAALDKAGSQVRSATAEIRSNIEFMNQVNQTFSYVQLPIRMSNQNTNTELFVYKNKMSKADDDEISAFLHFDMDHLGSTDISVKLNNRNVDTKFYMEDDRSYELIMNNIDILRKKIENKGYNCNINVENEGKRVNLVNDFLSHDTKGKTTPLSRYSFDVRA
ncbi:MAG: flagellar hook-length control protein FliK [Lachnospiraceae bacterium]|nr:flagellar hook-length control protein FliK [Lachnospiraceae bacterium]